MTTDQRANQLRLLDFTSPSNQLFMLLRHLGIKRDVLSEKITFVWGDTFQYHSFNESELAAIVRQVFLDDAYTGSIRITKDHPIWQYLQKCYLSDLSDLRKLKSAVVFLTGDSPKTLAFHEKKPPIEGAPETNATLVDLFCRLIFGKTQQMREIVVVYREQKVQIVLPLDITLSPHREADLSESTLNLIAQIGIKAHTTQLLPISLINRLIEETNCSIGIDIRTDNQPVCYYSK